MPLMGEWISSFNIYFWTSATYMPGISLGLGENRQLRFQWKEIDTQANKHLKQQWTQWKRDGERMGVEDNGWGLVSLIIVKDSFSKKWHLSSDQIELRRHAQEYQKRLVSWGLRQEHAFSMSWRKECSWTRVWGETMVGAKMKVWDSVLKKVESQWVSAGMWHGLA